MRGIVSLSVRGYNRAERLWSGRDIRIKNDCHRGGVGSGRAPSPIAAVVRTLSIYRLYPSSHTFITTSWQRAPRGLRPGRRGRSASSLNPSSHLSGGLPRLLPCAADFVLYYVSSMTSDVGCAVVCLSHTPFLCGERGFKITLHPKLRPRSRGAFSTLFIGEIRPPYYRDVGPMRGLRSSPTTPPVPPTGGRGHMKWGRAAKDFFVFGNDPRTGVAGDCDVPGRKVHSTRRSSRPAVRVSSRILLRSSSTREPSDPPLGPVCINFLLVGSDC